MMSARFQWGVIKPADLSNTSPASNNLNELGTAVPRYTPTIKPMNSTSAGNTNVKKRRFYEEESKVNKPASNTRKLHQQHTLNKFKRSKTPKILGQSLPINRMVEVLDHKSLQNLLQDLIQIHPEISATINKLSPKPTISNSISLLKDKFNNILNHLPYKCDIESDYSYLRIKSYLNEFLNCLSDFILNFLPPIELDVVNSLTFLDLATNLIHNLPNFSNHEFQYTKLMAYEQISNTWLIVLNQKNQIDDDQPNNNESSISETENSIKLVKIINELNLEDKLSKHNEVSMGKFKLVLEFIKAEKENFENINYTLNNNGPSLLSDLITVDYSNFSIAARTSH